MRGESSFPSMARDAACVCLLNSLIARVVSWRNVKNIIIKVNWKINSGRIAREHATLRERCRQIFNWVVPAAWRPASYSIASNCRRLTRGDKIFPRDPSNRFVVGSYFPSLAHWWTCAGNRDGEYSVSDGSCETRQACLLFSCFPVRNSWKFTQL